VLEALLQSPHFLYRLETGEPGQRLARYELAAKLSLLLLNTTPDDDLLDLAEGGVLDTDAQLSAVAEQMLESEAAASVMRNYHAEMFKFDRYLSITKNAELVPEYTDALNEELQGAAYLFFDRIFREDLGVTEILTSTVGHYGPHMASLYGLAAPSQGFEQAELGPERPGFFTHLPFLTLTP
jgi:hypothetical protein